MSDTIAAVATARGAAALGIIRISGPAAGNILAAIVPGTHALKKNRLMVRGLAREIETGAVIDEVMCFFAPGPATATGEDVAEIQGHGGLIIMETLLAATIAAGARAAEPGEFTYRAFRNGRMDLTQAEAVMSLIGARSRRAARTAIRQLAGSLGASLGKDYERLTGALAQLEAGLDFPDEDLPLSQSSILAYEMEQIAKRLADSLKTFKLGRLLTEGATVVLAGPSNAGKSSLFNRLVKDDRALVDNEPGTTRDVVEAQAQIDGIPIMFFDTAGLRDTPGKVERQGMERSKKTALRADVLLLILDGTGSYEKLPPELKEIIKGDVEATILVWNKKDLSDFNISFNKVLHPFESVSVSAITGEGIDKLESLISSFLSSGGDDGEVILTTARQHAAICVAQEHIQRSAARLRKAGDLELAATDLRWAAESLASLWGKSTSDEVINKIFSSFCLGK